MSAFGTKKRGADLAQQLTFPAVYSQVVSSEANPYGYAPLQSLRPMELPVGDALQDKYHEQKRLDAHRRVMNAVRDNQASTARFLRSHANYDVPKPVLSQRIYANPSNGNQADIYSHRPIQWEVDWSGLQGGVLFTQEAQKWGRQKLRDRIPQLDAIALAKQEFISGLPTGALAERGAPTGLEEFPLKSEVELVKLIESIGAQIADNKVSPLMLADAVKFLRLLFRWASSASLDSLEEMMEYVESIIAPLEDLYADQQSQFELGSADTPSVSARLLKMMSDTREYLRQMIGVANKSPEERKKASNTFIRSAGFTSLIKQSAEQAERGLSDTNRLRQQIDRLKSAYPLYSSPSSSSSSSPSSSSSSSSSSTSPASVERAVEEAEEEEDRAEFDKDDRDVRAEESASASASASSSSEEADPFVKRKSAEMPVEEAKSAEPAFPELIPSGFQKQQEQQKQREKKQAELLKLAPASRPRPANLKAQLYTGNAKDLQNDLVMNWGLVKARSRADVDEIRQNIRRFYGL